MSTPLDRFNAQPAAAAEADLLACCASRRWAAAVAAGRPYPSAGALQAAAEQTWWALDEADWREAFAAHARIGDREHAGEAGRREQAAVAGASAPALAALAEGNWRYEQRFGHIFLVCAARRSVEEMLAQLELRLGNDPLTELRVAAGEQARITRLRLERLLSAAAVTTHVLDLASGRPVAGLAVRLERLADGSWRLLAEAATNADGRVSEWPSGAFEPTPGRYRLKFATAQHSAFFPEVTVVFQVADAARPCHVPLLLSPYGYTTYRGN